MTGDTLPDMGTPSGSYRTLAVRLSDDLRAELDALAGLTGRSTTEELRLAAIDWIAKAKRDPDIQARVAKAAQAIADDAAERKAALEAMFGSGAPSGAKRPAPRATPPSSDSK